MIQHNPPGFIRPKAEAFAVNTYKHMNNRYSWFAAANAMQEMPSLNDYRTELVNLAAHEYINTGNPEQDTADAMLKVTRWHTMSLRANLNGLFTVSKSVHWPTADGKEQHWRLGLTSTDFSSAVHDFGTVRNDYEAAEDRDLIRRTLRLALPGMTRKQRRAYLLWLDAGGERGSAVIVAEELGVSRQAVELLLTRARRVVAEVISENPDISPYFINKV